jgi:hypothetical protein
VKKHIPIFFLATVISIGFLSCTKINEATELGGDLIPAVDNVNTFEVVLNTVSNNFLFDDSSKVSYSDLVAAGDLDDPEFGSTHANFYFNILPSQLGIYPFKSKDSIVVMDSVVLSLAFSGSYGDTALGAQTLRVYEVDQSADLRSDTVYRYTDPATELPTTGPELGSKTFSVRSLKDSVTIVRGGDTSKVANVVRIKLDNSLAFRFAEYDTTAGVTGGYYDDTAKNVTKGERFRKLFKGLAVKADDGGNVLSYYNLADGARTKLTVYFKVMHPSTGKNDTLSFDFWHRTGGQTNYIKRVPAGSWADVLNNGDPSDEKIYLQSSPGGSYASVLIPDLSALGNKVIHRAELIATKVPSTADNIFTPPTQLFLDRKTSDSSFLLYKDIQANRDGSLNFTAFDGLLKNNMYKFNITRYVQEVVTNNLSGDTLRLYAPLRTVLFVPNLGQYVAIPVAKAAAYGRVVLAGGSFIDPEQKLRLRIVYSNL